MAQNDDAVLIAAVGYAFTAIPGTLAPTPAQLAALDPETFGSKVTTIKITGTPTGGTLDIEIDDDTVEDVAHNVTPAALQVAIEAVIGEGAVLVSGTSISDVDGLDLTWIGKLQGENVSVSTTGSFTGGTAPAVASVTKTPVNGWKPTGHTSVNDMPEFGVDGGDSEMRGTWQKKKLREVTTDDPIDFLTMFLHQFDTDSLEMYYGEDAAPEAGVFGVKSGAQPIEKAFLVIIVDRNDKVGFYAAKASVKRDDSIQLPNDDFAALPIRATFLDMPGRRLFDWISEKLFR